MLSSATHPTFDQPRRIARAITADIDHVVTHATGRLDCCTAPLLAALIEHEIDHGCRHITIDLDQVHRIDDDGLATHGRPRSRSAPSAAVSTYAGSIPQLPRRRRLGRTSPRVPAVATARFALHGRRPAGRSGSLSFGIDHNSFRHCALRQLLLFSKAMFA